MNRLGNTPSNDIKKDLRQLGLPNDSYPNYSLLKPVQLAPKSAKHFKLALLVDKYVQETKGRRGATQLEPLKQHWCWILLGLSRVILMNNWLVVSLKTQPYAKHDLRKNRGLESTYVRSVIDYLHERNLIELLPGRSSKDTASSTRIYPKEALIGQLLDYSLAIEEPIEGPYLTLSKKNSPWKDTLFSLHEDHPDLADMIAINEFLKGQQWACKASVKLIYTPRPFVGGRLYTPFQNLPDHQARIRINTLINEKPICEVNFNANHLRMNLALNARDHAGDTPYEDICEIAGVIPASRVQQFVTVAMRAKDEKSARYALGLECFSNAFFTKIHSATLDRYPKLKLFNSGCSTLQSLEGKILKDVMIQGLQQNIVCLPIHDAIAVQQEHKRWAQDVMLDMWAKHLQGLSTEVTLDLPSTPTQ